MLYLLLVLVILFPLYWITAMSLKNFVDIISYPPKFFFTPTLSNYKAILLDNRYTFQIPDFIRYVLHSCVITGSAVLLSLILGLPAAYALTRGNSKVNKNIAFNFMSYRFAPELMVILPLYGIFKSAGLYDTFLGMLLVHQLITLPLIIWIMMGFFREIPLDLINAAKIDGANPWKTFAYITLPVVKAGIGSAMIIAFIFSWNNLLFGLIMSGGKTMPVTMGILQTMTFDQIKWGEMAACAMISAIPGIIIAVFCQRFLVKGLTMGAIK
jgi:multiple sugar transport system permease protein